MEYMPPTEAGQSTSESISHPVAFPVSQTGRDRPSIEPREVLAAAVDGQDRSVLERAAEIGLVGVAQVVLEVEVRLGAREVLAELLVWPRVLGVGLDVVLRLHHQIDLRLAQFRLAGDRLQHPGEHLVEVGERRGPVEAEAALQERGDDGRVGRQGGERELDASQSLEVDGSDDPTVLHQADGAAVAREAEPEDSHACTLRVSGVAV